MGDFIPCPGDKTNIQHWMMLKHRWSNYRRIVIGREQKGHCCNAFQWCRAQPGEFYRSHGSEVFYFENPETAERFERLTHEIWQREDEQPDPRFHMVEIASGRVSCCEITEYAAELDGAFMINRNHRVYAFESDVSATIFKLRWAGADAHA